MHINATFLVQIINFLITYAALNTLLFKPVIASLQEKKKKREELENSIKQEEKKLLALEKEKTNKITIFQAKIKKLYPFTSPLHYKQPPELPPIKKEHIDTNILQKEVTNLLIKKVPHGF